LSKQRDNLQLEIDTIELILKPSTGCFENSPSTGEEADLGLIFTQNAAIHVKICLATAHVSVHARKF